MASAKTTTDNKKPTAKSKTKKSAPTRTSSRSAKRRSPKEGEGVDLQQLELERVEFLRAMDKYKRQTGKTFPTWTEVLEVIRSIGWMHPLQVEAVKASKKAADGDSSGS